MALTPDKVRRFLTDEDSLCQTFPLTPQVLRRNSFFAIGGFVFLIGVFLLIIALDATPLGQLTEGGIVEAALASVFVVCSAPLLISAFYYPRVIRVGHGIVGWGMGAGAWTLVAAEHVSCVREAFGEEVRVCDGSVAVLAAATSFSSGYRGVPHLLIGIDQRRFLETQFCGVRCPWTLCRRTQDLNAILTPVASRDKAEFHHLVAHIDALVAAERDAVVGASGLGGPVTPALATVNVLGEGLGAGAGLASQMSDKSSGEKT